MIELTKGTEPAVLQRHSEAWTNELIEKLANGDEPSKYLLSRYAHPDIKTALLDETSEKCAYCESPLRHVTYGDIEHITPKSIDPTLRFSWGNLTIACDVCNTNKSDKEGMIDPYQNDPSAAFQFYGALIWATPGNIDARLTEEQLDLNRGSLVERRTERIDFLRNMIDSASSKPADVRDAMLRRAIREVEPSKPFSACGSTALKFLLTAHHL